MTGRILLFLSLALSLLGAGPRALPGARGAEADETVKVRDAEGLRRAVAAAKPGTRILVEPGEYPGGFFFSGLAGKLGKPIVIAGSDPKNPPVIRGSTNGIHLVDPSHIEIRDLAIRGANGNGLNIDDGGSYDTPAHHVLLSRLEVADIGPGGNHDGIKLSGLDDFRVEGCQIERWGTGGGSAIDMVGCHRGVIEENLFRHTDGDSSTGVQAKGGTSNVVVRGNRFENAGGRAVNIGGSTGLEFFRPPLKADKADKTGAGPDPGAERWEAKAIRVEGNTFAGGAAPVAFVGVDGAVVRFNTIYRPGRWALRILQETRAPGFVPSRNGEFSDNVIVFRAGKWAGAVNVGPGTAPGTFRFARNFWYAEDRPGRSRPELPAKEENGVYGKDPQLADPEKGDFRLRPEGPAGKAGAQAAPR